jgi:stearoyl-CoA desaturase (Delta-9 desaturase)
MSSALLSPSATDAPFVPSRPTLPARLLLGVFVAVPFAALLASIPLAVTLGWVSPLYLALLAVSYTVGVLGITIGYHRLFTHGSFKAKRPLRVALAIAGSVAVEGRLADWVADHRRHHKHSDADGDPHSPWEHGPGFIGLSKGLWHAHVGWLFTHDGTDVRRWAPDIVADRDLDRVSRWWPAIAVASLATPAVIAGLVTWSWQGLLLGFFWGSLVRVALVHHMTWSINSVCHVFGTRPFVTRDRSSNVFWLAPFSGGESWHNYHHADPTSARHGVLPRQIDTSARLIRWFEAAGWAHDVRWPSAERIASKRVGAVKSPSTRG